MTEQAEAAGPRLIHQGTYALFETPSGGRHVVFCRHFAADPETGEVRQVDGAEDEHLPDFPAEALPLVSRVLDHGIPPEIMAVLTGKASPLGLLRQLRNGAGEAEVEAAGDD